MAPGTFWSNLPEGPGVYLMLDRSERVIYVGRSGNLKARVRSYWTSDDPYRPDLRGMTRLVRRVDHIDCSSEHDAAFLERDLIARHEPRFNRTYGVEAEWWLRLSLEPVQPRLDPVRSPGGATPARHFGPYLGGRAVRLAAAALSRLYPIELCATELDTNRRELARARRVGPADLEAMAARLTAVLQRDEEAVAACVAALAAQRDAAAENELFEKASELQETIRAVEWLTQPRGPSAAAPATSPHDVGRR